MTLGRTSSGAIKIKTDGGLRAVSCACCGGGGIFNLAAIARQSLGIGHSHLAVIKSETLRYMNTLKAHNMIPREIAKILGPHFLGQTRRTSNLLAST